MSVRNGVEGGGGGEERAQGGERLVKTWSLGCLADCF